jgi:outer membrane protein assembly factor BamE (lipoprotein component of BamABCDE complex)
MRSCFLFFLLFLSACSFKSATVMTSENFHKTHVGMSEEAFLKIYGEPLNVYHKDNGEVVYEYVERFQMGMSERYVEARKYYFTIKNKKVIHKQMVISNQPGYDFMND